MRCEPPPPYPPPLAGEGREGVFNAAAAPATVSGEPIPQSHWAKPGKAVPGGDPRARRPTVDSGVRRRRSCGPSLILLGKPGGSIETSGKRGRDRRGRRRQAPEPGAHAP